MPSTRTSRKHPSACEHKCGSNSGRIQKILNGCAWNMNKNCARCNKVVYPIEELKCLDKVCVQAFCCHVFVLPSSLSAWKVLNSCGNVPDERAFWCDAWESYKSYGKHGISTIPVPTTKANGCAENIRLTNLLHLSVFLAGAVSVVVVMPLRIFCDCDVALMQKWRRITFYKNTSVPCTLWAVINWIVHLFELIGV